MEHGSDSSGSALRPVAEAGAALLEVLDLRIPTSARRWLARGTKTGPSFDVAAFAASFGDAAGQLGDERLDLSAGERDRLRDAGVTWPLGGWALEDLGRAVLLVLVMPRLPDHRHRAVLEAIWSRGQIDERRSLLRALPLLPRAHRFLDLALAGAESRVPELFEAIALDNPFPAAAFPDDALEALALRTLVHGAALDRIQGLASRVTPNLSRALVGYARSRGEGAPIPRGLSRLVAAGGLRRVG